MNELELLLDWRTRLSTSQRALKRMFQPFAATVESLVTSSLRFKIYLLVFKCRRASFSLQASFFNDLLSPFSPTLFSISQLHPLARHLP